MKNQIRVSKREKEIVKGYWPQFSNKKAPLPYFIGDDVVFTFKDWQYKPTSNKRKQHIAYNFGIFFEKSGIKICPTNPIFKVVEMRRHESFGCEVGVKVSYQDYVSCWVDLEWFEKAKS